MTGLQSCVRLSTGAQMPLVGIGTFLVNGDKLKSVLDRGIRLGYRLIDTALSYGNEKEIGDVLKSLEHSGKIRRNEMFITTKVPPVYLAPKDVRMSVEQSLENLQTCYVDLLLIHSPWGLKNRGDGVFRPTDKDGNFIYEHHDLVEAWHAFEEAFWSGKVKAIGVSNFTPRQINRIMQSSKVMPANLQSECHLYLQQRELQKFCQSKGITMTAFGPLGAFGRPQHHRVGSAEEVNLLEDVAVKSVAKKHKKTSAQVLLRFLLQKGFAVIPKTENPERLEENADLFSFILDDGDMMALEKLDKGGKFRMFPFVTSSKHPEFFKNEPF